MENMDASKTWILIGLFYVYVYVFYDYIGLGVFNPAPVIIQYT